MVSHSTTITITSIQRGTKQIKPNNLPPFFLLTIAFGTAGTNAFALAMTEAMTSPAIFIILYFIGVCFLESVLPLSMLGAANVINDGERSQKGSNLLIRPSLFALARSKREKNPTQKLHQLQRGVESHPNKKQSNQASQRGSGVCVNTESNVLGFLVLSIMQKCDDDTTRKFWY